MDLSGEDAQHPQKAEYQREVYRRAKEQDKDTVILIPVSSWKGNK